MRYSLMRFSTFQIRKYGQKLRKNIADFALAVNYFRPKIILSLPEISFKSSTSEKPS